jgi:hypothetical protein
VSRSSWRHASSVAQGGVGHSGNRAVSAAVAREVVGEFAGDAAPCAGLAAAGDRRV